MCLEPWRWQCRDRQIPGAHWPASLPASLAGMVSSSERPCLKEINWRVSEDTWHQSLASTHVDTGSPSKCSTHTLTHTHTHTCAHSHTDTVYIIVTSGQNLELLHRQVDPCKRVLFRWLISPHRHLAILSWTEEAGSFCYRLHSVFCWWFRGVHCPAQLTPDTESLLRCFRQDSSLSFSYYWEQKRNVLDSSYFLCAVAFSFTFFMLSRLFKQLDFSCLSPSLYLWLSFHMTLSRAPPRPLFPVSPFSCIPCAVCIIH